MTLLITSVFLALGISFLCSVLEACLLSLSPGDIAVLSEKWPRVGQTWRRFKDNLQRPIAVILVTNTLAHTIGATVSGAEFSRLFGARWIGLFSLCFSLIMIQWTELLPKTLGVRFNRFVAKVAARPLDWVVRFLSPLIVVMEFFNKPFANRLKRTSSDTLNDISLLARFAQYNNLITREQEDIVSRSINLAQTPVAAIMVDRNEMSCLSSEMTLAEALVEAHIHHHTRYPLIEERNLDKVIGYVNVKDIVSALKINPRNPSLKGIARPIMTIGPNQNAASLLKVLTKGYQHIAVVKDAQDHTTGLITMEDVIEAIVGDIEDEYDILPTYLYAICELRYLAGGGVTVAALRAQLGNELPELRTSLNEWLQSLLPHSPKVEECIETHGFLFTVRKLRRSQIYEVIVEKRQDVLTSAR